MKIGDLLLKDHFDSHGNDQTKKMDSEHGLYDLDLEVIGAKQTLQEPHGTTNTCATCLGYCNHTINGQSCYSCVSCGHRC